MTLDRRSFAASLAATPLLGALSPPPSPWRAAPPMPYPVQEIYPALHDGAIWIAGGFTDGGATERVIVFDVAAQQWRDGPPLPTPSHHVQLASLAGELWAIGGYIAGPERRSWICTTRVLKLAGDQWIEGPALPKPIAEGMPLTHQERIHLIGGRSPVGAANAAWNDQSDVDDHFVFAPGATQWERAAPLPMARNSMGGASVGGAIHIVSGRTVADGQTGAHHIFDSRAGAWREGPAYPEPHGGLAAATLNGALVAGGGELFQPPTVTDSLYRFDESAGWTKISTMPTPRHGHGFIAVDGSLYALGGAPRRGANGTLASVDVFTPG